MCGSVFMLALISLSGFLEVKLFIRSYPFTTNFLSTLSVEYCCARFVLFKVFPFCVYQQLMLNVISYNLYCTGVILFIRTCNHIFYKSSKTLLVIKPDYILNFQWSHMGETFWGGFRCLKILKHVMKNLKASS